MVKELGEALLTLDKAFRAQTHYKHAAISKVFIIACEHFAWNVDTFVKCQQALPKIYWMKKTEQRTVYSAKQVR